MRTVNLANLQPFQAVNLLSDPGEIAGPVVIPQCAQIVLDWSLPNGKLAHNVWTGRYTGAFAGSAAQANAIFGALGTSASFAGLQPLLSTATGFSGVTIRDVNTPNQPLISSTNPGAGGSGAGVPLPSEMAVCVTLRTALAGRANRGRTYLPGFTVADVGAGEIISAALISAVNAWAATWISVLSASGYVLCVGQKARAAYTGSTGAVHPARAASSVPIVTAATRDNHWDSQRRRGLK